MNALNDMPVSRRPLPDGGLNRARLVDSPELIERLAQELRLRSDPGLPHTFYVEQAKRQLAGRNGLSGAAARDHILGARQMPLQSASVFRAWAMPE